MARLLGKGLKMNEKLNDMDYLELLDEIERVNIAIAASKSKHLKNDYKKYRIKINKAITDYEKWYYNQDKYIAKKKIGLTEEEGCLYIGKGNELVGNIDKALSVGSEFLCSMIIDTFVAQRKDYQAKDFEIIKLRKGEE